MPLTAGIGLRAAHYAALLAQLPPLALVEVHSENFFGLGGLPLHVLERVRGRYPVSLHGVGLSLGSATPLSLDHLQRLRSLVERFEPVLVSEHLSWNAIDAVHLHDLLPLPRQPGTVAHLVSRIGQVQDYLRRPLLIENVSAYLGFAADQMPEPEFLCAVAHRAGCGLLLDISNIQVNAHNAGFDPYAYVDAIAPGLVGELHLAGHQVRHWDGTELWLDTHDAPVSASTWMLYAHALRRFGPRPTVIEWDSELPALEGLLQQAHIAQQLADRNPPTDHGYAPPARVATAHPVAYEAPYTLAAMQRSFGRALQTGGSGPLLPELAGDSRQATAHFRVYLNNHRIGLGEVLAELYPATQRLLGEACFTGVGEQYIVTHGKPDGSLLDFGNGFAEHLKQTPSLAALPWLPDVARLEWARHVVFHAADPDPATQCSLGALAQMSDARLSALRLRLAPTNRLLQSAYPVLRIHEMALGEAASDGVKLDEGGVKCLVARPGLQVRFETLSDGDFAFLSALEAMPLSDAATQAAAANPEFDLGAALSRWLGYLLH